MNSGRLKLEYPLIKPYSLSDLNGALSDSDTILHLNKYFAEELKSYDLTNRGLPYGMSSEVVLNLETGPSTLSRNSFKLSANLAEGNLTFRTSFNFDQRFKEDTTYFGELGEWYYGRFDESYLSYTDTSLGLNLAYGRVPRNLGSYASHSLILSGNPYTYDHLWFQYKNNLFSFSFMTSRLEDKYGFDNRNADSSTYGWYKRFYALHRLDLNLTDNFKLALTEAVLYGGKNQQWLSYYLNPLVPFYISKNNQRTSTDEGNANIYFALDIWYKPLKNITLFSQIFIDDIDFKAENRAKYPERKAFFGSAAVTELFIPFSQYGVTFTWVENWTYTSFYNWANYSIHQRGMGFPYNSYQQIRLFFDYFGFDRIILKCELSYTEMGETSLSNDFKATFEPFPMGVVVKELKVRANTMFYFSTTNLLEVELMYIDSKNKDHIANNNKLELSSVINLKFFLR